jgi:hypothetical protein
MSRGMATRTPVESIGQLGAIIGSMQPHQALALGCLAMDWRVRWM